MTNDDATAGSPGEGTESGSAARGLHFREIFSVHGYADEDGRLLGEHRGAREGKKGPPTVKAQCPYAGSRNRHERPMNVSALKQMGDNWEPIVDTLAFLHDEWIGATESPTLSQIWQAFVAGTTLPPYLLHRRDAPLEDGKLAASIAAAYKVMLGMKYTVEEMALSAILAGKKVSDLRPTAQDLLDYAETHGLLVGEEEVCAGSPKSILETLDAVVRGRARKTPAGSLAIERTAADRGRWRDFSAASMDMFLALLLFCTSSNHLQDELHRALGRPFGGDEKTEFPEDGPEASLMMTLGLRRISWVLAWQPEERRRTGLLAYAALAGLGDAAPSDRLALSEIVAMGPRREEREIEGRLYELLRSAKDVRIYPGSLPPVASLLGGYLHLERRAIRAMAGVEARLGRALGRPAPAEALVGADVAGYCGNVFLAEVGELLGPSVVLERGPERTTVRVGSQSIDIA